MAYFSIDCDHDLRSDLVIMSSWYLKRSLNEKPFKLLIDLKTYNDMWL